MVSCPVINHAQCKHYASNYTLLKVVSHYELRVMGSTKKTYRWRVGEWSELYPVLFWIMGICLTLQSP